MTLATLLLFMRFDAFLWEGTRNRASARSAIDIGAAHLDEPEGGEINLERREGRGDRRHDRTSRVGIEYEGIDN